MQTTCFASQRSNSIWMKIDEAEKKRRVHFSCITWAFIIQLSVIQINALVHHVNEINGFHWHFMSFKCDHIRNNLWAHATYDVTFSNGKQRQNEPFLSLFRHILVACDYHCKKPHVIKKERSWSYVCVFILTQKLTSHRRQHVHISSKPSLHQISNKLFRLLSRLKIVCHCWSGRHINSRWFPKMDQIKIGLPWIAGFDRGHHIVFLRTAEFNSGRHLLFPIDRPLCSFRIDNVFGLLPNDSNRMVLWRISAITQHQTNDR